MTKQATYEEYAQWVKYVGGQPSRTEYINLTFSEKEAIKNEVTKTKIWEAANLIQITA